MPEYFISGVNAKGRRETHRIEASSPGNAVRSLRELGYSDVKSHSDDFSAASSEMFENDVEGAHQVDEVSAEDMVSFQTMTPVRRFFQSLKRSFTQSAIIYIPVYAFFLRRIFQGLAFRRDFDSPLQMILSWGWDGFLLLLMAFPFIAAFMYARLNTAQNYNVMLMYSSWYLWDKTLEFLPPLKGKIPDFEYAIRHATALSGLGRFEEAAAILKPFKNDPNVPGWMYYSRLPEICYPACRVDLILSSQEKAHQLAPDNDTIRIDYATSLVRFNKDIRKARELLSEIDLDGVSEIAQPFLQSVLGLIALEEQRGSDALQHFLAAMPVLEKYAPANPLCEAGLDIMHGSLCRAYAQIGEMDLARKHFKKAEKRLRVYTLKDRLESCEKALAS